MGYNAVIVFGMGKNLLFKSVLGHCAQQCSQNCQNCSQNFVQNILFFPLNFQCLQQYLSFEIMAGAYEISCPDSQCPKEGIFLLDEIEKIVGKELSDKYKGFRLNTGQ